MAAFDTNRTTSALVAGRTPSFFATMFAAISAWNDARITRKSLSKLSARELNDIGLSFSDIDNVARRTFR